jgi:hypothetical protein
MYWEVYDDQEAKDFDYIGYTDLSGTPVTDKVAANLAAQVAEIKRTNGQRTEVRVYRR